MKTLTKDEIFDIKDIDIEQVDMTPFGWPGAVYVSGLTGAAHSAWERSLVKYEQGKAKPTLSNARAKLLVRCVTDENRRCIFEETDIERLGLKSARAIEHLYKVAQRLSGLTKEDAETLVKNSEPSQGDSLNSD